MGYAIKLKVGATIEQAAFLEKAWASPNQSIANLKLQHQFLTPGNSLTRCSRYTATGYRALSTQKPLSPWSYKPWWCQPWSILVTGTLIVTGSWAVTKTVWITILISIPILVWWTYFLLIWPQMMKRTGVLENYQPSSQDSIPQVRD